jgi:hypothetical protein
MATLCEKKIGMHLAETTMCCTFVARLFVNKELNLFAINWNKTWWKLQKLC